MLGLAGVSLIACFLAVYIYHCKSTCFQKVSKCWCCQKTTLAKRRISKELGTFRCLPKNNCQLPVDNCILT